jgi:peptide/nickel transport system substrate-binding protein
VSLVKRRDLLRAGLGAATALIGSDHLVGADAFAMGRVPVGGTIELRIPWSTDRLDPHDLHDPLAAFFGAAIADPVYGRAANGRVYPTLADGMPFVEGDQTVVKLRPDLQTARGLALGGRDLAWSITRARKKGAAALLAGVDPFVRSDPDEPLIARFGTIDPARLAWLLSSPLCALLPVGFQPSRPDGTGALKATCSSSRLVLQRNDSAARGPSFLSEIVVRRAGDLAASLRAFESGQDDLGWLGRGFHRDRRGSRPFDYGTVGWVVLVTGAQAGRFAKPGMAQRLADGVPVGRLHVGLRGRSGVGRGVDWEGGPASLLYDAGDGHLGVIAEAVAAKLSSKGNEITARGLSRARFRSARKANKLALALDVVRHPGPVPSPEALALTTADGLATGRAFGAKLFAGGKRTPPPLHVGVLGELGVHGGVASSVLLAPHESGHGIDWGASYRHP